MAHQLRYCLLLHDDLGHPLTVVGVKTVGENHWSRMWKDTTTVYIRLYKGGVVPCSDKKVTVSEVSQS